MVGWWEGVILPKPGWKTWFEHIPYDIRNVVSETFSFFTFRVWKVRRGLVFPRRKRASIRIFPKVDLRRDVKFRPISYKPVNLLVINCARCLCKADAVTAGRRSPPFRRIYRVFNLRNNTHSYRLTSHFACLMNIYENDRYLVTAPMWGQNLPGAPDNKITTTAPAQCERPGGRHYLATTW